MDVPINCWAILLAAVVNFVLGGLWFGPLFGKAWLKASGWTQESLEKAKQKKSLMIWGYISMFVGSLVMAFVLEHNLVFGSAYLGLYGWMAGLQVAFWNWLGFVVPVTIGVVFWQGKSWKFWAISYLYTLVGMVLMGVILAWWM